VVSDAVFRKTVENLVPMLKICPSALKIVTSPPCYQFNGCCTVTSHVSNLENTSHCTGFLSSVIHLRNLLKKQVVANGIENCWILDCCAMATNTDTKTAEQVTTLKPVFALDRVYFSHTSATLRTVLLHWNWLLLCLIFQTMASSVGFCCDICRAGRQC
jgi:hypothetical protein